MQKSHDRFKSSETIEYFWCQSSLNDPDSDPPFFSFGSSIMNSQYVKFGTFFPSLPEAKSSVLDSERPLLTNHKRLLVMKLLFPVQHHHIFRRQSFSSLKKITNEPFNEFFFAKSCDLEKLSLSNKTKKYARALKMGQISWKYVVENWLSQNFIEFAENWISQNLWKSGKLNSTELLENVEKLKTEFHRICGKVDN